MGRKKKGRAYIGCSGFSYNHWKDGVFYPPEVPQGSWLEYYAGRYNTVELNVTFYRLPEATTFLNWAQRTPEDFRFAVKGSKLITHVQTIESVRQTVDQFMDHASALGPKLGPILWQMPPSMKADRRKLRSFIDELARHKDTLHAFEFRHKSWFTEPVYQMVRKSGMAVVSADYAEEIPEPPDDFDFIYIRRHGLEGDESYPEEALARETARIQRALKAGKNVYLYFNNDARGHAPRNAAACFEMLTIEQGRASGRKKRSVAQKARKACAEKSPGKTASWTGKKTPGRKKKTKISGRKKK